MYREHILDAAEAIFAEHGYETSKVQSVAASAGVSLATLYGVFETKWDLYRAVHERRTRMLQEHIRARGEAPTDLLDRMLDGIAAYVEFHMAHPAYLRMHLRDQHIWSTSVTLRSPEQIDAWQRGLEMMSKAFSIGQEAGVYHADESPELMARTTFAMHQVRLGDWVDRGMEESPGVVVDAVKRQFIRTFCTDKARQARLAAAS